MKTRPHHRPPRVGPLLAPLALLLAVACAGAGCETVKAAVALPFDMAAYAAMETARIPYETAKIGAQGIVDVFAAAMR